MLYNTQNPHGGDVYGAAVTLDFSSNVHPLGTPPGVVEAIRAAAAQVRQYPDPYCRALTAAIAAHEGVPQPYVLCGGGAAELIYAYCDALRPRLAAEFAPTFSEYRTAAAHFGAQLAQHPLRAPDFLPDEGLLALLKERKPDVLFLCTPNNPTGMTLPRGLLEAALRICRAQGTRVLLDECFLDFTDAASAKDLLEGYGLNVIITRGEDELVEYYGENSRVAKGYEADAKYVISIGFTYGEGRSGLESYHGIQSSNHLTNSIMYYLREHYGIEGSSSYTSETSVPGVFSTFSSEGDDGRLVYDSNFLFREAGGKATFAGQMDTRSQQNEAYSEANGMQGMEFDFACLSDSDDVRSYQENKETMIRGIVEGFADALDLSQQ